MLYSITSIVYVNIISKVISKWEWPDDIHPFTATMKHDVNSQAEVKNETKLMRRSKLNKVIPLPSSMHVLDMSNRSGSGGQVQLWQFLIDLLTSPDYRNIIHWLGKMTPSNNQRSMSNRAI